MPRNVSSDRSLCLAGGGGGSEVCLEASSVPGKTCARDFKQFIAFNYVYSVICTINILSSRIFDHLATLQLTRRTGSKSTHPSLSLTTCHKAQELLSWPIPTSYFRIHLLRSTYLDPLIWIYLPGSTYLDPLIWIHLPGSTFLDPRTWIHLPGSTYLDPLT
jgi:hypothetical protein